MARPKVYQLLFLEEEKRAIRYPDLRQDPEPFDAGQSDARFLCAEVKDFISACDEDGV